MRTIFLVVERFPNISYLAMTHIHDIRNALNAALEQLNELELALQHRSPLGYERDTEAIGRACARQFNIAYEKLFSSARGRSFVYARQIAMFLMSKHTTMTVAEVAGHFKMHVGNVRYALEKVQDHLKVDNNFAGKIARAEAEYLSKNGNENQ